jgi:uncharacterized protein (DUF58 family)
MLQRFLDPATLAAIDGLDLIAKTVVQGFVAGLHRSPDFGFSQEFAEYRAYVEGDDLRHVDWNVFARTERAYLKRYRGETNTQITVMMDTSGSMAFGSQAVKKIDFARFLAASLCYMANAQRDAAGLIIFSEEVTHFTPPSTRQGQIFRLLHAIEKAEPGARTDYTKPLVHFQNANRRRGVVVLISDFYEQPEVITRAIEPIRQRGSDVILFHTLDPQEIKPQFREPLLLEDMETGTSIEISPEYAHHEYRRRIDAHIESVRDHARGSGLDYFLMDTSRPLDEGLREYLRLRQGRM